MKVYAVAGGFPLTSAAEMLMEGSEVWTDLPSLPVPVKWTSGLALHNSFYVLGGFEEEKVVSDKIWKLEGDSWKEAERMSIPRRAHSSAVIENSEEILFW